MEKLETNSLLIINYFRRNYIKMICFIILSLIVSLSLTYVYKKLELYYSKFQVNFNRAMPFDQPINLKSPHYDFIFFFFWKKKDLKILNISIVNMQVI